MRKRVSPNLNIMRRTWRKAKPKPQKRFRVNAQIRIPEVFLIDEKGENIGVMAIHKALAMAREAELDLVEVNPKEKLSVVKIMDYGQFKYDKEKKAHKQRMQQKKIDTKGIRLSVRISKHDFEHRVEQAVKFFQKGHKLKIDLVLKGREKQHPRKAVETINAFVAELDKKEDLLKGGNLDDILKTNVLSKDERTELVNIFNARKAKAKFKAFIELYSKGFFKGGNFKASHVRIRKAELPTALNAIYDGRSGYLHRGEVLYLSRPMRGGQKWDTDPTLGMIMGNRRFSAKMKLPYSSWFQRLVRHCIMQFIAIQIKK